MKAVATAAVCAFDAPMRWEKLCRREKLPTVRVAHQSTGSLLYELLLAGDGRPKSEVRCELRVHRRVSPGRGFWSGRGACALRGVSLCRG